MIDIDTVQPGDKLIIRSTSVTTIGKLTDGRLRDGALVTVSSVERTSDGGGFLTVLEDGPDAWNPQFFKQPSEPVAPNPVSFDFENPQRRAYDFAKGDVRRFDFDSAVALANERARERGVRQSVRPTGGPLLSDSRTLWLVQDI